MRDFDLPGFGDTIVAEESTIYTSKPMVRAFIDSTIEGWQFAKENREEALSHVLRYSEIEDKDFEKNSLDKMIYLIFHQGRHLGANQESDDWTDTIMLLEESGEIKNLEPIDPSKLYCNF